MKDLIDKFCDLIASGNSDEINKFHFDHPDLNYNSQGLNNERPIEVAILKGSYSTFVYLVEVIKVNLNFHVINGYSAFLDFASGEIASPDIRDYILEKNIAEQLKDGTSQDEIIIWGGNFDDATKIIDKRILSQHHHDRTEHFLNLRRGFISKDDQLAAYYEVISARLKGMKSFPGGLTENEVKLCIEDFDPALEIFTNLLAQVNDFSAYDRLVHIMQVRKQNTPLDQLSHYASTIALPAVMDRLVTTYNIVQFPRRDRQISQTDTKEIKPSAPTLTRVVSKPIVIFPPDTKPELTIFEIFSQHLRENKVKEFILSPVVQDRTKLKINDFTLLIELAVTELEAVRQFYYANNNSDAIENDIMRVLAFLHVIKGDNQIAAVQKQSRLEPKPDKVAQLHCDYLGLIEYYRIALILMWTLRNINCGDENLTPQDKGDRAIIAVYRDKIAALYYQLGELYEKAALRLAPLSYQEGYPRLKTLYFAKKCYEIAIQITKNIPPQGNEFNLLMADYIPVIDPRLLPKFTVGLGYLNLSIALCHERINELYHSNELPESFEVADVKAFDVKFPEPEKIQSKRRPINNSVTIYTGLDAMSDVEIDEARSRVKNKITPNVNEEKGSLKRNSHFMFSQSSRGNNSPPEIKIGSKHRRPGG